MHFTRKDMETVLSANKQVDRKQKRQIQKTRLQFLKTNKVKV